MYPLKVNYKMTSVALEQCYLFLNQNFWLLVLNITCAIPLSPEAVHLDMPVLSADVDVVCPPLAHPVWATTQDLDQTFLLGKTFLC
jgi:hypothetical protein